MGVAEIDATYRARLETLLGLDELIATIVDTLETAGALENTYIVLTSDHGYHLGEHRIFGGKGTPYEEAIHIPLVVRGPEAPVGRTAALASNIDLAPTIAGWAGAEVPAFADGRSLAPALHGEPSVWREAVLVSHHHNRPERSDGPPAFKALRMRGQVYVEYAEGWRELYDLETDPHQIDNRFWETEPATVRALSAKLAHLAGCAGERRRESEDAEAAA